MTGSIYLGTKKETPDNLLFIGRKGQDNVYIDSEFPHVVFICGARGSGKSYTLGVLMEELLQKNPRIGCILIDPVGVFWSMKNPTKEGNDWDLKPKGFPVHVLVPEGAAGKVPAETFDGYFSLSFGDLKIEDWCLTFGLQRFEPAALALDRAIKKSGHSIDQIIATVAKDPELSDEETGFSKVTRRGLVSRLESAKSWGVLSDKGTSIEELSKPGHGTIIDVSFLEESVANLVIGIIARKILEARKIAVRAEAVQYKANKVPPTWLLIDEAHTVVPVKRKTPATNSIVEFVKQGRRPHCSIVLATQQPSAIDAQVLSQLDIMITHTLVFQDDIKAVLNRFPSVVEDDKKAIRTLPTGHVLIGDRNSPTAFRAVIRPRQSQHEGRSVSTGEAKRLQPMEVAVEKHPEKKIDSVPRTVESETAAATASANLSKFLIFATEQITERHLVHYPLWQVHLWLPTRRLNLLVYVDALIGEIFSSGKRSVGLPELIKLEPVERNVLLSLKRPLPVSNIAHAAAVDEEVVNKTLRSLLKSGLIGSEKEGEETRYFSKETYKIPGIDELRSDLKFSLTSAEGALLPSKVTDAELREMLSVFSPAQIRSAHVVYYPYWVFRTSKNRKIAVDAVTNKIDEDVGRIV